MIEASTQFMVGRVSTECGKCNRFNLDGIFGNDNRPKRQVSADVLAQPVAEDLQRQANALVLVNQLHQLARVVGASLCHQSAGDWRVGFSEGFLELVSSTPRALGTFNKETELWAAIVCR
jgi:hypothetical protein